MTSSADVRGTRGNLMYAMHAAMLAAPSRVMVSPVLTYLEKKQRLPVSSSSFWTQHPANPGI